MASGIYNSVLEDIPKGSVDCDTDTFKVVLVTNSYTFSKAHNRRDDLGANEITGTGYTAGGNTVAGTVTLDGGNNRVDVAFAQTTWPTSTINAYGAAYYKARGGASSADELVGYNDFGGLVATVAGTFTLPAFTLRLDNPA